jgi:chitodextrinase
VNYELGTKFQSTAAGQITGIRFYKASQESGTHTGHIWSSTGTLLATVTFSGETASGWQTQNLTSPLSISAGTTYTVSVNTAGSYYVATNGGLASAITNGPLSTIVGGNGTYGSVGAYPTNSWQTSNYYRDVVFTSGGGSTDATPPSAPTNLTASAVSSSQINLTWTASTDNVGVTGYKIFRDGTQVGTSPSASFSDTGLSASTVYSYTVSAYDAANNTSAASNAAGVITLGAGTSAITVGSRVVTTANLNVRQSPSASATKLGTESIDALGTVIGGPTTASGHTWWQVNYDNAVSGWSIGDYLGAAAAASSPAVGMAAHAQGSLTLIQQLLQQVQALSLRFQSLQTQVAGAGAATY